MKKDDKENLSKDIVSFAVGMAIGCCILTPLAIMAAGIAISEKLDRVEMAVHMNTATIVNPEQTRRELLSNM